MTDYLAIAERIRDLLKDGIMRSLPEIRDTLDLSFTQAVMGLELLSRKGVLIGMLRNGKNVYTVWDD